MDLCMGVWASAWLYGCVGPPAAQVSYAKGRRLQGSICIPCLLADVRGPPMRGHRRQCDWDIATRYARRSAGSWAAPLTGGPRARACMHVTRTHRLALLAFHILIMYIYMHTAGSTRLRCTAYDHIADLALDELRRVWPYRGWHCRACFI